MDNHQFLRSLFDPKSIAIIGASSDFSKVSSRPLKFLLKHQYRGKIFPVNPKEKKIAGLDCYSSIKEIEQEIDLAIIIVPAGKVVDVLSECVDSGVKFACIISSGFAEMGERGKKIQEEIKSIANNKGLRIVGPNCVGIHNLESKALASISQFCEVNDLKVSPIAFISQSGAFGTAIAAMAHEKNIGLTYFISSGNEADLEFSDYLNYVIDDIKIKAIAGYVEGIKDGQKFLLAAQNALEKGKPIILTKVGKSSSGSKAASSHTGSLTGSDDIFEAVCSQKNIIRCYDVDELLDFTNSFAKARKKIGRNVGIISMSGGAGVLMADKCEELGLNLPDLSEVTKLKLGQILPNFANLNNPVDVTGQFLSMPNAIKNCIEIISQDQNIDTIILFLSLVWENWKKICDDIVKCSNSIEKQLSVCWTAAPKNALDLLEKSGVTNYSEPVRCIKSIDAVSKYEKNRKIILENQKISKFEIDEKKIAEIKNDFSKSFAEQKSSVLNEKRSKEILKAYGIPVTDEKIAVTWEEAIEFAEKIGWPVALKICSADIMHKTEAKGVELNIRNKAELREAFQRILKNSISYNENAKIDGILVQEMLLQDGIEVIAGMKNDIQFGPTVMFGFGGMFVEVLKDVSLKVCPFGYFEAENMIKSIKGYKILKGYRGKTESDINAIIDILIKLSALSIDLKDYIAEMDLNPIVVFKKGFGAKACDAIIKLK